ncbi:carboxypeptidase [Elysia marginata]|uniref:Carboxypeptidase n=1 Tax=Elysia marginata TaxID=1093978 RepID=A0AAV4HTE2_9GAST|nr:carboxypeptidase [Elysia marginata]
MQIWYAGERKMILHAWYVMSYAGKYVASLANKIHSEMEEDEEPDVSINMRGIFSFSGFFDPFQMFHSYPQYLLTMGLISEKKARNLSEKLVYALDKHRLLGKHEEAVMDLMDSVFTQMHKTLGFDSLDNALSTKKYDWHFEKYLNKPEIQHVIHARACQYKFQEENILVHMAEDFIKGVSKELKIALENYKVLMVSGQMDMVVSVPMVESFLHDFRWSGMSRYLAADKIMWRDGDGEVAGYVTEVKNLTRVVMRKAGHRPALDQPEWTLEMMTKFLGDQSFAH